MPCRRVAPRLKAQMQADTSKRRPLPFSLKVAIGLFAIHLLLYAEGMFEAYSSGRPFHMMWFFHLLFAGYVASLIPKQVKGSMTSVVAYCVIISAYMLRVEYVTDAVSGGGLSAMTRAIATCAPLLLAAVAVLIGRKYYASDVASTKDTARTNV